MPLPVTVPQYVDGSLDLTTAAGWDLARAEPGPFWSPTTPEELEAALWPDVRQRADAISQLLEAQSVRRVASYGAGAGFLEYLLIEHGLEVVATDYGAGTVERLRGALPEAEVVQHDLHADTPLPADVHLFHRIDTEFTDGQWRRIFTRFQHHLVLLAASEVLSGHEVPHKVRLAWRNRAGSRAGWLRNRKSYENLWARTHRARPVRLGDLRGWLLR